MVETISDIIPQSNSNRPGTAQTPTTIVVHETANFDTGADAQMHAEYMKGQAAQNAQVSWHWTVDDTQAIQHVLEEELAWHAGDGNENSIGIEFCVNDDGDWEQTKQNGMDLIAEIIERRDSIVEIKPHHHYDPSQSCPPRITDYGFDQFVAEIKGEYSGGGDNGSQGDTVRVIAESVNYRDSASWDDDAIAGSASEGEAFTIEQRHDMGDSTDLFELVSGTFITTSSSYVEVESGGSNESSGSSIDSGSTKQVHLPSSSSTWRTYQLDVEPVTENSDWKLTPSEFGGLSYEILDEPYDHVYTIDTSQGKRNIYAGPDTSATIE